MESANQHFLRVQKTARVFTLGVPGPQITEVWMVLHGYAQLAQPFLEQFKSLEAPHRFLIAPEGQNYFYAKGFGGKPVATWMTSELREHQIEDYLNYLNQVYEMFRNSNTKFVLLGFSQGVATASRWLNQCAAPVNAFIIHSGELASELVQPTVSKSLLNTQLIYVTGTKDPLIKPEKHEEVKQLMSSLGARLLEFEGGHEIKPEIIARLAEWV